MCGLGMYCVHDFRRWNGRRSGPVGLRTLVAMVIAALVFPSLVILGGVMVLKGFLGMPGG